MSQPAYFDFETHKDIVPNYFLLLTASLNDSLTFYFMQMISFLPVPGWRTDINKPEHDQAEQLSATLEF